MLKYLFISISTILVGLIGWGQVSAPTLKHPGDIVAYRAGGQIIDYQKLATTNCSAKSIVKSENTFLENTIESLNDAANTNIAIFHINIHRTRDNQFVVFHDWTLDCATNGSGAVHEHSYEQLASLDAGYGYTFDEGRSYPFRGKGYKIDRLDTILDMYPNKKFWLNLKNNDEDSFLELNRLLTVRYKERANSMVVISSENGVTWFEKENPQIRVISVESTKKCIVNYMLYGWSGVFPDECSNKPILLPPSKVKYLWGYPEVFAARAQANGSQVYLWGEHRSLKRDELNIQHGIGVITGDLEGIKKLGR